MNANFFLEKTTAASKAFEGNRRGGMTDQGVPRPLTEYPLHPTLVETSTKECLCLCLYLLSV